MSDALTLLMDNQVYRQGLKAEHGLSILVEKDGHRLLFDTGQSGLFLENAEALGINISNVETIVLSHGHYDHTGGLPYLLEDGKERIIYGHAAAFEAKYSCRNNKPVYIGIPVISPDLSEIRAITCSGLTELYPGIWAVTDIPRKETILMEENHFWLDKKCTCVDMLEDDLTLVIETREGLVIVLGCAHAGLSAILDYIGEEFPGRRMQTVLGGTHLVNADNNGLERALDALQRHEVRCFRPGHCTGLKAMAFFMMQGFVPTEPLGVGVRIPLGDSRQP